MIRVFLALLALLLATPVQAGEESFNFVRFGTITVYRGAEAPGNVVLFFSGPKGWNSDMAAMARALVAHGALVVGLDTPRYRNFTLQHKKSCLDLPDHLELLSHYVQQRYKLGDYRRPIVIDASTGAPLAYGALASAATGTFKGAISIGFSPKLAYTPPPCRGDGLNFDPNSKGSKVFLPYKEMQTPWIALEETARRHNDKSTAAAFVAQSGNSSLMTFASGKHRGASSPALRAALLAAFDRLAAIPEPGIGNAIPSLEDLPLVEVPATVDHGLATFAVLITGDGGWAGIDREVSAGLAARGIPVVGLSSLRYFWHQRTPDGAAADMQRIIKHYANAWHKQHVLLIGYSFGADTLPFIASRLPQNYKNMVIGMAFAGLSDSTKFEYQVPIGDLFGDSGKDEVPVPPEIARLTGLNPMCIYGADEKDDPCATLPDNVIRKVKLKGGHHFDGDYDPIINAIAEMAK